MKINIEFTVDEFCSIKNYENGGTVINFHHFHRPGNDESIEKENLEIRKGEWNDGFVFMDPQVVYIKIVKEHAKIDAPAKTLVIRSKSNSKQHRKKKLTGDKNKKYLKRLKHKNRFGELNND